MRGKIKYVILTCIFVFLFIAVMPSVFAEGITINFDTDENNLGFIYFDYSPTIYATATNKEEHEETISISAEATDENGSAIWSDSYIVKLPGYSSMRVPIRTDISRFGLYSLSLTVNNVTVKQEFSIANRPRDGAVSKWCMLNDHTATKGHGIAQQTRKMELLSKAGFGGIRQEYLWESFEPIIDSFTVPKTTADTIELMSAHNMDIMGIMMGCPKYVSEYNSGKLPVTDDTLKEWSKYAEHTAEKTKDISTHYEIWNEYNMKDGADPENYIKLLQASYDSLHKNPKAVVCGFSAANIGSNQTEYDYSVLEWIDEVLKLGGGEYMDAVSIHCYTHRAPEDDLSDLANGKTWLIDETRALLDKYGYTDMPIIVSEMGWNTLSGITETEKAQYMIRYSAMNYGKIDRLYWYVSQDKQNRDNNGDLDEAENTFGIINTWDTATGCENPYGAKPAFLALSNFNAMMTEATVLEECETEEDVYKYKFKDRDNNDLYIVWSTKSEGTVTEILSGGKYVTVYDIYGNIIKADINGGIVNVELSESPVYIKLADETEELSEYKPKILVNYNTGEMNISGNATYSSELASLALTKKGTDATTPSDIAYIGQSVTDVNGKYKFNFALNDIDGLYTVRIGFAGMDKTQEADAEFDISVPTLSVLSNGNSIKNISQLADGAEMYITLEGVRGLTAENKTQLAAAVYNQGKLKDIKVKEFDVGSGNAELNIVIGSLDEIDKIKIFFWKQEDIQPLMGMYEIK